MGADWPKWAILFSKVLCVILASWSCLSSSEKVDYQPTSSLTFQSVSSFSLLFFLCFSTFLQTLILRIQNQHSQPLCGQITDALIRWVELIESKLWLGVDWGVRTDTERRGRKPGNRHRVYLAARTMHAVPPEARLREMYLDEYVHLEYLIIWDDS